MNFFNHDFREDPSPIVSHPSPKKTIYSWPFFLKAGLNNQSYKIDNTHAHPKCYAFNHLIVLLYITKTIVPICTLILVLLPIETNKVLETWILN